MQCNLEYSGECMLWSPVKLFWSRFPHHCPGCNKTYLRKTGKFLSIKKREHNHYYDKPMHRHFDNCPAFDYIIWLFKISQLVNKPTSHGTVSKNKFKIQFALTPRVLTPTKTSHKYLGWFYIKILSPSIKNDSKVFKELRSFQLSP